MKRCPNCSSVFEDNTLINCVNCGANLIEDTVNNTPPLTNNNPNPNINVYPNPDYYNNQNPNFNGNPNPYGAPQFKYCSYCGNQCDPKAAICVRCGKNFNTINVTSANDKPSGGLKVLCFFIPLVGLILYLVNMNDKPVSAKAYGKVALISFIISMVLYALMMVASFILPFIFAFSSGVDVYSTYPDSEFFYSMINSWL